MGTAHIRAFAWIFETHPSLTYYHKQKRLNIASSGYNDEMTESQILHCGVQLRSSIQETYIVLTHLKLSGARRALKYHFAQRLLVLSILATNA
jgi:hypothetical protein